jgi:heme-degrading monooxygenase HmoA
MHTDRRTVLTAMATAALAMAPQSSSAAETPVRSDHPRVARVWHGRTPAARVEEYRQYLFESGVKKIAAIPGNRGVQMMSRVDGDVAEFMVASYWDSIDAIKGYAGEQYTHVHDLPRDSEFLIDKETLVRHFALDVNFWQS